MTRTPEADQLVGWLSVCVRAPGLSEFERSFCISILGREKRGGFVPSEKQMAVLRRIVARVREEAMGGEVVGGEA
jgi:hypothetical protein